MYRVAIITLSDTASKGERSDESGRVIAEIVQYEGYEVVFQKRRSWGCWSRSMALFALMMGIWAMGPPIIMSFLDFGERSASSAPFPINSVESATGCG